MIPIYFIAAAAAYEQPRPPVSFSADTVAAGATVAIHAKSSHGWVWDLNLTGTGECSNTVLDVKGATLALGHGFSGDETAVDFSLTHDGVSKEIIVTYNTRPD